jgi:ketosteroid isomerase-like protein
MKNLYTKTTLILLILVLAGTQLNAQKEAEKLKTEIKTLNDKMIKAGLANDLASVMSIYSDNVISLPNYGPMISGKKALMEKNQKDIESGFKMLSMNFNTDEVFPDKQYVTEVGHYVIKMSIPGMPEPINDNGKYITVWERQADGSLKVLIETWNTDVNPMEMQKKMMDKEK